MTRHFMTGSYGGVDYLIVAKSGAVVLGAKPLFGVSGEGLFVGFRIRSAPYEGKDLDLDSNVEAIQKPTPQDLVKSWPKINFAKHSESRASNEMGLLVGLHPYERYRLAEVADTVISRLVRWVVSRVPKGTLIDEDDFRDWVREKLTEAIPDSPPKTEDIAVSEAALIDELKGSSFPAHDQKDAGGEGKPLVDSAPDKVVSLKPKKPQGKTADADPDGSPAA